ncbi:MAG: hypothetical protein LBM60_09705 [Clostridium sp.]|jgi:hypothetical protein|nr:hypothetical protein [Clostridium sp.]
MNDVTVDKKLQLVRQIRSSYHQNQNDLQNRERILYGHSKPALEAAVIPRDEMYIQEEMPAVALSTFKIRLLLALFLLFAILAWDITGQELFGITTEQVFKFLSEDFTQTIQSWIGQSPTL